MLEEHAILSYLQNFDQYPFSVEIGGKEYTVGTGEPAFAVRFRNPVPLSALARSTSLALGEAYMNGDLEIEGDLYNALDHFLGQIDRFSRDEKALKKLLFTSSAKKNQQREVRSHYDIGNDFYRLWLDETMSYSCGYFVREDDTLYEAQVNKVDYILKKLHLKEGMTLLDVGCGWGFLLLKAARKYRVRGVGITLSTEQYKKFRDRIRQEGLETLLQAELMDYRDIPRLGIQFDRVVSVGMAEHVGRDNYPLFMESVGKAMRPGGLFLLHFISSLKEHAGDPWIRKYIFPGGVIPSLREMLSCAAEENFHTLDVENLRLHYNKTLLCWMDNFKSHINEIRKSFDEKFIRMWELYLCSCAATFHNGIIDLHQLLLTKGVNNELPLVRWYS